MLLELLCYILKQFNIAVQQEITTAIPFLEKVVIMGN
jgi:hypothetical protein